MSSIRVENVVKPPHIPTDINKKISFLWISWLLKKAINIPITKQPNMFEIDVPIGKIVEILLKYFVIKNLIELPIPPPKKTKTKDFKSNPVKFI